MRAFIRHHKVLFNILCAMTLVIVMVLATLLSGGQASPLSPMWRALFTPIEKGFSAVAQWVGVQYSKEFEYNKLDGENAALRARIAELEAQVRDGEAAVLENERLYKLLNLTERRRDLTFATATVVGVSANNWQSAFTLDRGTSEGLAVGMCVVNEELFFAGIITEVGDSWATVVSVIDSSINIGAMVSRTGDLCVASGQYNDMTQGKLRLTYLSDDAQLNTGDLVLTSGVNQTYPQGLVIGAVTEIKQQSGGLGYYAKLTPSVNLDNLRQVFIITAFDIVS